MSERLKIAVLGAGCVAFGPGVLHDALLGHKLPDVELALVDSDEEAVFPMADLGRRMAAKVKLDATITAQVDREAALAGASYVICGPTVGVKPGQAVGFNGVAGIAHSVRQIAAILEICDDIKRLARPGATLLNLMDPLPRVCQAAQEAGVSTVGFCSASLGAYKHLWEILHEERFEYPFDEPRAQLDLSMAGLNHLTFALDLWNHATGEDLYPRLKEHVAEGRDGGQPVSAKLLSELGYYPAPGDALLRDVLSPGAVPVPPPAAAVAPLPSSTSSGRWGRLFGRGTASPGVADPEVERGRQLELLRAAAAGQRPWNELLAKRSWEKPVDLIAAIALNRPTTFTAVNVANQQQFPTLPRNVFVEVPATADAAGIRTPRLELPDALLPLLQRVARLNDGVVRASRWRRQDLFHEVIELDPTIEEKAGARDALEKILPDRTGVLSASA